MDEDELDSTPSAGSMSPTSFQALSQTTGHRFNERRSLVWTQLSPLVIQDLAEIVGRDNIISTRDAPFDKAPDVFDGLQIGRVRTLKQEIYALRLGKLDGGVRGVWCGIVELDAVVFAKPCTSHGQNVLVQSLDDSLRVPRLARLSEHKGTNRSD